MKRNKISPSSLKKLSSSSLPTMYIAHTATWQSFDFCMLNDAQMLKLFESYTLYDVNKGTASLWVFREKFQIEFFFCMSLTSSSRRAFFAFMFSTSSACNTSLFFNSSRISLFRSKCSLFFCLASVARLESRASSSLLTASFIEQDVQLELAGFARDGVPVATGSGWVAAAETGTCVVAGSSATPCALVLHWLVLASPVSVGPRSHCQRSMLSVSAAAMVLQLQKYRYANFTVLALLASRFYDNNAFIHAAFSPC